ncbi:ASCH domain-containing protein [Aeromonas veronii]|uniref:hypothetical protein n=1 Tax=Aeromonas veronii TaxID=654 RepID=UPI00123ACF95|nr:hypothetical protein [Aeromonas veronii]QET79831.1 hypothetical protein FOB40_11505 [Aeromonas veronii]
MTERPVIFNDEMVRGIMAGRKTQTRRLMKPQPEPVPNQPGEYWWPAKAFETMVKVSDLHRVGFEGAAADASPFGRIGDRLWVRETWGVVSHTFDDDDMMIEWVPDRPATKIYEMPFGNGYYSGHVIYRADGHFGWCSDDDGGGDERTAWHPSIHMPRAACRTLLEIADVRVERLHAISEADARAEGVIAASGPFEAQLAFHELWRSIYGQENWQANPWVWVVEFKQVQG